MDLGLLCGWSILIYHTQFTAGSEPAWPHHLYAQDSYDGVTFTPHADQSGQRGILNGTNIQDFGSVKKVALFGDYPLAIVYSDGYAPLTATTGSAPSDFSWIAGHYGGYMWMSPESGDSAFLESSDGEGRLANSFGAWFTGPPSGQITFDWSPSRFPPPPYIYRGTGDTATFFSWPTSMGACP